MVTIIPKRRALTNDIRAKYSICVLLGDENVDLIRLLFKFYVYECVIQEANIGYLHSLTSFSNIFFS